MQFNFLYFFTVSEPHSWDFPLFVQKGSHNIWTLNDDAVRWIYDRLHRIEALQASPFHPPTLAENLLRRNKLILKKALQRRLLYLCPFDWSTMLGPDPSQTDIWHAKNVSLFADNRDPMASTNIMKYAAHFAPYKQALVYAPSA